MKSATNSYGYTGTANPLAALSDSHQLSICWSRIQRYTLAELQTASHPPAPEKKMRATVIALTAILTSCSSVPGPKLQPYAEKHEYQADFDSLDHKLREHLLALHGARPSPRLEVDFYRFEKKMVALQKPFRSSGAFVSFQKESGLPWASEEENSSLYDSMLPFLTVWREGKTRVVYYYGDRLYTLRDLGQARTLRVQNLGEIEVITRTSGSLAGFAEGMIRSGGSLLAAFLYSLEQRRIVDFDANLRKRGERELWEEWKLLKRLDPEAAERYWNEARLK